MTVQEPELYKSYNGPLSHASPMSANDLSTIYNPIYEMHHQSGQSTMFVKVPFNELFSIAVLLVYNLQL